MVEHDNLIDAIVDLLRPASSLLFITGAGISADSGLPTYRGIGGLYNNPGTEDGYPIEVALSGQMFVQRPELTWKYLDQVAQACQKARFNRGHEVLALMEQRFERVWILTQNVDGFHRDAGSTNVIDIHGDFRDMLCSKCGDRKRVEQYNEVDLPPKCPKCGTIIRPDVILFGELLPPAKVALMQTELGKPFDLIFTVGTTSVFPYIAGPVVAGKRAGIPTIEINPGDSEVSHLVDIKLPLGAAAALDAIWTRLSA